MKFNFQLTKMQKVLYSIYTTSEAIHQYQNCHKVKTMCESRRLYIEKNQVNNTLYNDFL